MMPMMLLIATLAALTACLLDKNWRSLWKMLRYPKRRTLRVVSLFSGWAGYASATLLLMAGKYVAMYLLGPEKETVSLDLYTLLIVIVTCLSFVLTASTGAVLSLLAAANAAVIVHLENEKCS